MAGRGYKFQLGISLVELLVAMVIQFILLAGMVYVYGSSRTMFTVNQELSRVQENGRYASDTLLYDIRMAGFAGCRSISEVAPNILANAGPTFSAVTDGLNVYEDGAGWTNPTAITRLTGTDVITVQSISGAGVPLSAAMASASASISVASNPDAVAANDLLLVYDCSRADLIRASSVGTGTPVSIAHNNTTIPECGGLTRPEQRDGVSCEAQGGRAFRRMCTRSETGSRATGTCRRSCL
ncbi:MAG: PilW family protein [Porticoccaceae bacterium]